MKRWNRITRDYDDNPEIDAFIAEVVDVCKKHGFVVSHEDIHGSFIVKPLTESRIDHLKEAAMEIR